MDCKQSPQYYVDGEELKEFLSSDATQTDGIAYEWEGENVAHLRFMPLRHAFGKTHKVSFAKAGAKHSDAVLKVDVHSPEDIEIDGKAVSLIPAKENLYKRAKGLLEVGTLADKRVLIIGLGSGGAPVAVELAKAGVGHFVLVDFDRVELHNLSRHICDVNDLGRLKTDAIEDAILGKNPYAEVIKYPIDMNEDIELLNSEIEKADIVMVCTDNNKSRYNTSELLVKNKTVGIFGRAVTRAEGGDVFIYRPGNACYFCLLGSDWFNPEDEEITNYESAKRSGQIPAYVSEADAEAFVQVGLSSDIEPITNMMVKLALVELSRGTESGINSLEDEFTQNYYMWANRREHHYINWGKFNNRDRMPTIMKWYGVDINKEDNCHVCGEAQLLTETGETRKLDDRMGDLAKLNLSDLNLPNLDLPDSEQ